MGNFEINLELDNYIKIGLYGDSLSLSRPGVVKNEERYFYKIVENYTSKTSEKIIETIQRSKASITASELASSMYHDNVYYNWEGELCILHLGIVDCAPRPIDKSTREKISGLPSLFKKIAIKYLHSNRRNMLLKGTPHYVTPINVFTQNIKDLLDGAISNYKKTVVINICPTNPETEYRSPGLGESIRKYNEVLEAETNKRASDKIIFIDIYNAILKNKDSLDEFIVKEDGHHLTPKAHQLIFDSLETFIK